MKTFATLASIFACASAGSVATYGQPALAFGAHQHLGYATGHAATVAVGAPQHVGYAAGPVQTHIQEHIVPAGPAIAQHHVQHGVVGTKTVQVGTQQVQVGHQYNVAGQSVHPRPAYTYVAKPAQSSQSTVALAEPLLPYAALPSLAIPAAPTNQGPAPADTVTVTKILAPGRVHTQITPQVTRITPQLQVNKVPYDVQVNVPVAVEREVVVNKVVNKPYAVEHQIPVAVPEYYPVHQVRQNVVRPVVREHTVSHSHAAPAYAVAAGPAAYAVAGHAVAGHAAYAVAGHAAYPVAGPASYAVANPLWD